MTQPNTPGLALFFDVQIDGVVMGIFTGCSGLEASYEAFEWQEGGDNGTVARLPGRLSYSNVRLTRPVDADSGKLASWFSRQQAKPQRFTAHIRLYDESRQQVASWTLDRAWPVKYSGPRLTTGSGGAAVAIEILELAHQGFTEAVPGA